MVLTEEEVSLIVDGLRCGIEKWQGMVDDAMKSADLNGHPLVVMLGAQIERAEALKDRLLDADGVGLL